LNVDDHAPARFVRTRILKRAGFEVDERDNAAQAIERAPHASLLLLDVRLPDGDGFSVCERVKRASPGLPVVLVTSVYQTAQARRDAFAAGADRYLLEPVSAEHLVRTVESLINRPADGQAPAPLACLTTDTAGYILDLTEEAAKLLNISARGARGRNLPSFFTDNRSNLIADIRRASEGMIVDQVNTLNPRDRRPLRVHIDLSALPPVPGEHLQLRWIVSPEVR
jgi:DNA-binding response OmpR family regulator